MLLCLSPLLQLLLLLPVLLRRLLLISLLLLLLSILISPLLWHTLRPFTHVCLLL